MYLIPFSWGHYIQGTQGPGDPGTQIGMHCVCMYSSLEPRLVPRPMWVLCVGLCLESRGMGCRIFFEKHLNHFSIAVPSSVYCTQNFLVCSIVHSSRAIRDTCTVYVYTNSGPGPLDPLGPLNIASPSHVGCSLISYNSTIISLV